VALSGVLAIAGSTWNGYAVRTDGTVWAWGDNAYGQLGGGWRSYSGGSYVPAPVPGLTDVTAVAAGYYTGYALRGDGTVWAWGYNDNGALGNGTLADSRVPVRVTGLTGVVAIASGMGTGYALRADGTVWAWGDNSQGELGNGSTAAFLTSPVQVTGLTDVTAIAASNDNGYALLPDGTVRAWGANGTGELGHGQPCAPCESRVPVPVSLTTVTAIAAGGRNAYAIRTDGTVWSWGLNDLGNLGNGIACDSTGTTCRSSVPVQVVDLTGVTQIASLGEGGSALLANGTVKSWGNNYWGALGNDSVSSHTTVPVPVTGISGVTAITGTWGGGYALVP
jgi:alpha-tubulin suppressor-like RCC1 family protein